MKIVYLDDTGTLGGAGMCLIDLVASLRSSRPDWKLEAVLGNRGPLADELERLGVMTHVLVLPESVAQLGDVGLADGSSSRGGLLRRGRGAIVPTALYVRRLRRRLRALAPDIVHTNGMKSHLLAAWATPRGVPVLWQLHGRLGPVMARLMKGATRRRGVVVGVSHWVSGEVGRTLPGVRVETIYNAVDLERFAPGPGDPEPLDHAAGLEAAPAGTVRIGLLAAFARLKGHDVFLDAAARLPRELPVRWYLIGGPIYRSLGSQFTTEELRAKADALGLSGRVAFTGFRDDPAAALRAMDIVVLASVQPESFGRAIVEGLACAKAVVTTAHGGTVELFEEGVTALGCPPADPDALAAAMRRLIEDPALRRRMGEAGRAHVVAHFDRRHLADHWVPLYERETA